MFAERTTIQSRCVTLRSVIAIMGFMLLGSGVSFGETISVEPSLHHLGDEYLPSWGLFSLMPDYEGHTWVSDTFDVSGLQSGQVSLSLETMNWDRSTILVNGHDIGLTSNHDSNPDHWDTDTYIFNSSFLRNTDNQITIQCRLEDNNYDDFLFRDLSVNVPEPASLSLLTLGGLTLIRKKRK